jgi:hypothetical protein
MPQQFIIDAGSPNNPSSVTRDNGKQRSMGLFPQ